MANGFNFPGPTDRVSIIGSTGSGKTRFATWLFSHSYFKQRPYVIMDFKGDDLLKRIPHVRRIGLTDTPKKPGLYYVRPLPDDDEAVERFFQRIWQQGNVGIYVDEGYMIPGGTRGSKWFNAILTQGRSLKVPCITLTQRPSGCSRFVFSEANYYSMFRLNDLRDAEKAIGSFTPRNDPVWDLQRPLAEFHSRWYDVKRNYSAVIAPVPSDDEILGRFDDVLRPRNKRV